jgi:hypothetical protein
MRFEIGSSRGRLARDIRDRRFQDQRRGIELRFADPERNLQREPAFSVELPLSLRDRRGPTAIVVAVTVFIVMPPRWLRAEMKLAQIRRREPLLARI